MRNKLVLTLWLVGAVLYAGSTAFLAHAVLGGGSVASPADKAKAATVAAATGAQCEKDSLASGDAKPAKDGAADPQKTAAIEPKKPAPAPSAAKPASPEIATRDAATPGPTAGAPRQPVEEDAPVGDQQDQAMLGPDGAPIPDGWQDQGPCGRVRVRSDAMGPAVLARRRACRRERMGECDRRHRRHAVRALDAGAAGLCAARGLAGAGDLRASRAGCRCRTPIAARRAGSNPRRSRLSPAPRASRPTRLWRLRSPLWSLQSLRR